MLTYLDLAVAVTTPTKLVPCHRKVVSCVHCLFSFNPGEVSGLGKLQFA